MISDHQSIGACSTRETSAQCAGGLQRRSQTAKGMGWSNKTTECLQVIQWCCFTWNIACGTPGHLFTQNTLRTKKGEIRANQDGPDIKSSPVKTCYQLQAVLFRRAMTTEDLIAHPAPTLTRRPPLPLPQESVVPCAWWNKSHLWFWFITRMPLPGLKWDNTRR